MTESHDEITHTSVKEKVSAMLDTPAVASLLHGPGVATLLRHRIFTVAFILSFIGAFYWMLVASDRYVSEAHVVIQDTNLTSGQSMDFGGLLGGMSNSSRDQLLLLDYLVSVDMLNKLDAKLGLKSHYSSSERDLLSGLWSEDASLERFHDYYLSRVSVDYDDYTGILVIKAQAYDSETAHAISMMLVDEGERYMNYLAQRLAQEQVLFLEKQVEKLHQADIKARQAVLSFQNEQGLVSPQATAENIAVIINGLEGRITELQTRRDAMLGYLMPGSPNVVDLDHQIAAVKKQIKRERSRLASPKGKTLNATVELFQRLQMDAEFSQEVYKTALVALEKGRIEASRTLKMVSVLQSPTRPQYPIEPRRAYNTVVFIMLILLMAGVMQLLGVIIRDHKD